MNLPNFCTVGERILPGNLLCGPFKSTLAINKRSSPQQNEAVAEVRGLTPKIPTDIFP